MLHHLRVELAHLQGGADLGANRLADEGIRASIQREHAEELGLEGHGPDEEAPRGGAQKAVGQEVAWRLRHERDRRLRFHREERPQRAGVARAPERDVGRLDADDGERAFELGGQAPALERERQPLGDVPELHGALHLVERGPRLFAADRGGDDPAGLHEDLLDREVRGAGVARLVEVALQHDDRVPDLFEG